ncbi:MAG: hypothetical protein JWO06_1412 [Bacteroidota bacterium]|nr:hypothetical protein [Bacteroidota bacterium]
MRKILWIVAALILNSCQQENINSNAGDDVYPDYYDNGGAVSNDNGDNTAAPTYQTFYDQLSPYGSWVNDPTYGYMWVPTQEAGFSPYMSNGHWINSEYGWTWVSDYDWGWAPFHYGRWHYGDGYGWMWAPGYDWAPAWVTWGDYGGY